MHGYMVSRNTGSVRICALALDIIDLLSQPRSAVAVSPFVQFRELSQGAMTRAAGKPPMASATPVMPQMYELS